MKLFRPLAGSVSLGAIALSTPAFAQEVPAAEEEAGGNVIIVTAQKREQDLQDVPAAVTAIGAEEVEKLRIVNSADIVRIAPTLTATESNNKTNSSFSIRGIGTNLFGISAEQAVAFVIDDVAMPQQGQSISNIQDIQSIEVLRGPQSTLVGKAASAGAIVITTKGPSDILEGSAELTISDENLIKTTASLSGPLGDNLGFRVSGYWLDRDGYQENLTPDRDDLGGEKAFGIRGKLRWDISDSASIQLGAYYAEEDSNCCARTYQFISPGAAFFGFIPQAAFADGIDINEENTTVRLDDLPNALTESWGVNLRVNLDIGDHSLVSITAFDKWDYRNTEDVDFGDLDVLAIFTGGALNGGFNSTSVRDARFYSQELRLLSPTGGTIDYVLGAYYSNAETERTFVRNLPVALSNNLQEAGTEYIGVYGQLNWNLSDSTTASFGLRYFNEEITGAFTNFLAMPATTIGGSSSDSDLVGKFSLQHRFTDNTMVYASYSRGYKGQLYDLQPQFNQNDVDNPVQPESSDAFEIGIRNSFLDNRLRVNVTGFLTNYDNYQVQTAEIINGAAVFDIRNAGSLETYGIELETFAELSNTTNVTFNLAWVESSLNNLVNAPCFTGQTPAQGCVNNVQTIDDGTLPSSPELKYAVALDHRAPLSGSWDYFANASYTWQDDVQFGITQQANLRQDAYGIANFRVGVASADDKFAVSVFVNNAFDQFYRGDVLDASALFAGTGTALLHLVPRGAQRYVGGSLKVGF